MKEQNYLKQQKNIEKSFEKELVLEKQMKSFVERQKAQQDKKREHFEMVQKRKQDLMKDFKKKMKETDKTALEKQANNVKNRKLQEKLKKEKEELQIKKAEISSSDSGLTESDFNDVVKSPRSIKELLEQAKREKERLENKRMSSMIQQHTIKEAVHRFSTFSDARIIQRRVTMTKPVYKEGSALDRAQKI